MSALQLVRGEVGHVFYGGVKARGASFGAAGGGGGPARGTIEMTLPRAAAPAPGESRFEVTCLEVAGARAWIGVRAIGAEVGGDVWYVEDGGPEGVDRVGVWVGLAPDACRTKPAMPWALPVERGEIEVAVG